MARRPDIGLGDLATALGRMGLLDGGSLEDAQRVARVLGLQTVVADAPVAKLAPPAVAGAAAPPPTLATTAPTPTPPTTTAPADAGLASLAITVGARPSGSPLPLAPPLPAPLAADAAEPRPPLDPLFSPASSRSLISTALSTWQLDGAIDVPRLVHRVASGRPVVRMPRRPRLGLHAGVQLLLDHGAGMDPFARDAAALADQMRAIAGAHRVEVLRFAGDPLLAGPGPRRTWRPYRAPGAGVRVIAVTDLGIAAPRLRLPPPDDAWLALAAHVADARGSLLCLVPYPAARWPAELAGALTIAAWDRSTTVPQLRHLIRSRA